MRHGFTLIEVVIALILFQVALLALAGTTALAARDHAMAHRTTRAQTIARNRLALLRAQSCPSPGTASTSLTGGFTERWTVEGSQHARQLSVTVHYQLPRGRAGQVSLRGSTLCQQ